MEQTMLSPSPMPVRSSLPQKAERQAHSELMRRFEKALRLGGYTHTFEDVMEELRCERMQSFAHNNAIVVTQIITEKRAKYLNVFLAVSDDVNDVMAIQPRFIEFARQHGCHWIQTLGRRGWISVLPKYGWKPTHTLFVLRTDQDVKVTTKPTADDE